MATKITEKDNQNIEWLLEKENHGLQDHGLSEVVKILIKRNNELVDDVRLLQKQIKNIHSPKQ